MLQIWVLNVGHGDSIVLKYVGPTGTSFGVIDSNHDSSSGDPAALKLLRDLGATELSFVMLTHPHADHFRGLLSILDSFTVRTFYTYPMGRDLARLKSAGTKYLDAALLSDCPTVITAAEEFVRIIIAADKKRKLHSMEWLPVEGPTNRIRPFGFAEVTINALLPFKKAKGEYFNALDSNRADSIESELQNVLSIAIDIEYGGQHVALCGDALKRSWIDHRRELQKANERVSFSVVKLPHHGSAADCDSTVLDYLFESQPGRQRGIAILSAEGSRHHPSPSVLRALRDRGIMPYCTNLSTVCGNNVREVVFADKTLSPELAKVLNIAGARTTDGPARQPCQGHICVTVDPNGEIAVNRQFQNSCTYRGDFDGMMSVLHK